MPTLGAFALIFDAERRVLLSHRTDRDAWNLPGGRVEADETPWDAVVREVREETGLVVRVDRLLGIYAVQAKDELVFSFLCEQEGGELIETPEADQHAWFEQCDLPANTLPRHVERIADASSKPGHPLFRRQP